MGNILFLYVIIALLKGDSMWKIKNIKIDNQVVLAPMAGISNPAFMKIGEELGLGLAYTELISAEAVVRGNKKTFEMLNGIETLKVPVGVQLFGSNAETLAKAAKIIVDLYKIAFIDINMGCPVPKVAVRAQAGAALMKDIRKIEEIVKAVVECISIPVTVKIRSGWDNNSINAVEVAKICEKAGASAICVHARTRKQGYSGKADWNIIRMVKEAVNIPVIGNGDVANCYSAKKMLEETGCDAVMIGRALLGNPWLIEEVEEYLGNGNIIEKPTVFDKIDMCLKHLNYLSEIKPDKVVALEMRNHIAWYIKGLKKANEIKQKTYLTSSIDDIIAILNEYREYLEREG